MFPPAVVSSLLCDYTVSYERNTLMLFIRPYQPSPNSTSTDTISYRSKQRPPSLTRRHETDLERDMCRDDFCFCSP
jgi:hypothetical protein